MDTENTGICDYYILPMIQMCSPRLRLGEENEWGLEAFRFPDLQHLYTVARRVPLRQAA